MTKSVLLVGSSFSAAPVFFELKRRGYHVSVCGGLDTDPCHQYADASFNIDYSKRDELLRLVETRHFDYLVPTCNDYSYMSCAWLAEQRRFPGFDRYDVAATLHAKNAFRELMERHALPSPRSRRQKTGRHLDSEGLQFPLLVKPADAFSGRGVTKVMCNDDLSAAVEVARAASRSGAIVLEEFVEGRLYSHSAFIRQQAIAVDFFVDEYCTVYPYQVNCSNHPSSLPDPMRNAVRQAIARLVGILGLQDGLLHTQFIADGDRFWIVECMRRCPGDLYGRLVELSAGIDYTDLFVRPFLDEPLPVAVTLGEPIPFGRHTISTDKPLIGFSFSYNIAAAEVQVVALKNSGERIDPAPFDKLAILFAEYASLAAMFDITPKLAERITIHSHPLSSGNNLT